MRDVCWDMVVIKVDDYEREVGGLYRAEMWKSLPDRGTVIGVGPEVTVVKVGDHVKFKRFASIDNQDDLTERYCSHKHILEILHG